MSSLPRSGGKRHYIKYRYHGLYEIGWAYEWKYAGSRLLFHRWNRRETDRAGAERFAKKWGCKMPETPQ